jgi:hypothetical protein
MRNSRVFPSILVGLLLFTGWGGHASTLEDLMGEAAFAEAGLGKLSAEERQNLLDWILLHEEEIASAVKAREERRREAEVEAAVAREMEKREKELEEEQKKRALNLFGFFSGPREEESIEKIETRIAGEFKGWRGDTRFHLENGQVWEQRSSGRYYKRMDSPKVTIRREMMGYWMTVEGVGARVAVKRVK